MENTNLMQIQQKINTHKINLAQNLTNKQVEASAEETLASLIGKINTITEGSAAGNPPVSRCINFRAVPGKMRVELYWEELGDLKSSTGGTYAAWAGTRVVRKEGAAPQNENDGTVVTESTVLNQYQEDPYIDTPVEGKEYYYGLFSYTADGVFSEGVYAQVIPISYKIMTVVIDQTDEETMKNLTYEDNAVDMPSGKEADAWDTFFGHRPCILKDGRVVGYLNPNNFYQFEDGSEADITNPELGDVMIEFPRRGLHIETIDDKVYVKMTDSPNAEGFEYYAHNRGTQEKDAFYISAFFAFAENNKLRSYVKSGITSGSSSAIFKQSVIPTYPLNMGDGYSTMGFYQWTYIQAMFLLKYKGLDSQSLVGKGYGFPDSSNKNIYPTLGMATKSGMDYGNTAYTTNNPVKLFGIEFLWGGLNIYLAGIRIKNSTLFLGVTNDIDNFYSDEVYNYDLDINGFYNGSASSMAPCRRVIGSSKYGFVPKEIEGNIDHTGKYYADSAMMPKTSYTNSTTIEYPFFNYSVGGNAEGNATALNGRFAHYNNGIFCAISSAYGKYISNENEATSVTFNNLIMYI